MPFTHAPNESEREEPRWYVCYTRARHEKRVDEILQERGVESFLPLVTHVRQWADRKKKVSFVLFPSYVFVRFALSDLSRVLSIPGITAVVRSNGRPVAIREEDLENVRRFAAALGLTEGEPEPVPLPEEGVPVRIMTGPFEGVEGVVVEQRGRRRVLVGLQAIGQGMEVDVDAAAVEPLPG